MGHRFLLRHTLGQPIFLQFLDACYQLLHQRPEAFEFNEHFLADVAAIHDGRPPSGGRMPLETRAPFDTDFDCQRTPDSTSIAWAYLLDERRVGMYANPSYDPNAATAIDGRITHSDIMKVLTLYGNIGLTFTIYRPTSPPAAQIRTS